MIGNLKMYCKPRNPKRSTQSLALEFTTKTKRREGGLGVNSEFSVSPGKVSLGEMRGKVLGML